MRTSDQKSMKTLQDIEACPKTMLSPQDVSGYLQCDPYNINATVMIAPELLGFPICKLGNRVKIPKEGFLRWARGLDREAET